MNDLAISRSLLDSDLHQSLIQYVYGIIGCMQYVHRQLGPSGLSKNLFSIQGDALTKSGGKL